MSLLELPRQRRQAWPRLVPTERTISGAMGVLIGFGSSADLTAVTGVTTSTGSDPVVGTAMAASTEEYDPDFVKMILEEDDKPAVAKFTNVIDMLGWLDRD